MIDKTKTAFMTDTDVELIELLLSHAWQILPNASYTSEFLAD